MRPHGVVTRLAPLPALSTVSNTGTRSPYAATPRTRKLGHTDGDKRQDAPEPRAGAGLKHMKHEQRVRPPPGRGSASYGNVSFSNSNRPYVEALSNRTVYRGLRTHTLNLVLSVT